MNQLKANFKALTNPITTTNIYVEILKIEIVFYCTRHKPKKNKSMLEFDLCRDQAISFFFCRTSCTSRTIVLVVLLALGAVKLLFLFMVTFLKIA